MKSHPKIQYPVKLPFKNEYEIKKLPDKPKLREFFARIQNIIGNLVFI